METKKALQQFVEAINATGGVAKEEETGLYAPVADASWIDLGEAYLDACKALGVEPVKDGENDA